jgi:hypothetical protein
MRRGKVDNLIKRITREYSNIVDRSQRAHVIFLTHHFSLVSCILEHYEAPAHEVRPVFRLHLGCNRSQQVARSTSGDLELQAMRTRQYCAAMRSFLSAEVARNATSAMCKEE